ncbi:hypothetical protein UFOVP1492_56 [uncultured Caudovirales phage]|uniref:Uncharacterized protein n=1 Tax=uncultured Caudovirales phage TaxID=2100421 RepID=A0A6J5RCS8_9CAUD|nr:hypothetical protein UFOVP1127_78 [uncultured Caudovirales phage]CAB4193702.1 hypothetical protein UFOVP1242_132 [uncultured Caudovirales phage]CAB4217652.1 hypothetical protein UFOVP1492_56 [uncultured Caudovirales phage]CAB5231457.1 hypothetical protein UFOVP1580_85 [uncultured Caudovirales phage]
MQTSKIIQQKDLRNWMLGKGVKYLTVTNSQTGNSFMYRVEWAEYDIMAPDANIEPPIYISSLIAQTERTSTYTHPTSLADVTVKLKGVVNETIYMGCILDRNEYIHYDKLLPAEYPACKIWNFLFKSVKAGKEIPHIELYEGLPTEEGMDLEAVTNLQYGAFFPIEKLGNVEVAHSAVAGFLRPKNGLQCYNHQRSLISRAVQNSEK